MSEPENKVVEPQEIEVSKKQEYQVFNDDMAFLNHIITQKVAEEVVDIPEWDTQVLCKALSSEGRIKLQIAAYDFKTKTTDLRRVFPEAVLLGSYNPATGNRIFKESHRDTLLKVVDGGPVEKLAMVVLRLSHLLAADQVETKKN